MVSPSKSQHQEQKHPPRKANSQRHSQLHIHNGEKPLDKKSFYLDIKNHAIAAKIETKIKDLGGAIELFLVRSVSLVVSDRVDKTGYVNPEKRKWGCTSGGSGGLPSLRSLETPTPMSTTQTPFFSSECPLSNSTNLRGQTAQRSKSRVDAMLERALIQPQQCSVDPLDNAQNWGIPIWAIDKLQAWLDKIYASFKEADHLKRLKQTRRRVATADLKVRHLKGPYIKFESFHRSTRPVFVELPVWPTLNINGDPGSCPFNTKRREKPGKSVRKEVKENREAIRAVKQEEAQEMTRRPRTTAARLRRTEQLASGYCEICRVSYRDLTKHVQTDQHVSFVRNEDNFLSLDTLINAGADVEAFLKLNRTKDIEKDCNLFPNGDRNLHDIVLPEGKDGKSTKSLDDFRVGDIKMVQCNGARRNLNLKLSSPHNLRARTKHESGHLLRSKGSPWHEVDKTEKFYDKFEGFTIKKRAKGTIWIEEDEPGVDFTEKHELKDSKEDFKIKNFSSEIEERCYSEKGHNIACNKNSDNQGIQQSLINGNGQNGISNLNYNETRHDGVERKVNEQVNGSVNNGCIEDSLSLNADNGIELSKFIKRESCKDLTCDLSAEGVPLTTTKCSMECERINANVIDVCNGHTAKETAKDDEQSNNKTPEQGIERAEVKEEKSKCSRSGRRGGRGIRGRHRLSVEERLIEDNRAYYKVEVLGSKLRSSVLPQSNSQCPASKGDVNDEEKKEEVPSSEKPVVVRFKRVRKSELSLLSDEAESFMFGEPRRDDSSETSDVDQSSVLPKDTESDYNDTLNDVCPSSPLISSCTIKSEMIEEDSQDSICSGRTRKRRRTQAEALIKDNVDYYKFETPGSRLRYQAPLTGIKESVMTEQTEKPGETEGKSNDDAAEKMYPSKPSAEVEKMQFSFEAVPKSEPWYQTYQRQDEGAEFWHYFSEGDSRKPFLLPYEIENFHEHLAKTQNRLEGKRKGRGRSTGCVGRSPRKSPRCHASTLAIMSTIIRKREQQQQQQQQSTSLYTIDECQSTRSQADIPRAEQKQDIKSDVDEELKDMAKTIDDMLNANDDLELDNSFEPDPAPVELNSFEPHLPKGPPCNLIELLENCHDIINCLENSSCASSECGEGNTESPMKRRKKRKNRTGWPGIKMKKKLRSKSPVDTTREKDSYSKMEIPQAEIQLPDTSSRLSESSSNGRAMISVVGGGLQKEEQLQPSFVQRKDEERVLQSSSPVSSSIVCHENNGKRVENRSESNDRPLFQPSNAEECADLTVSEHRNETEKNLLLSKEYEFRKGLTSIDEISESYLDNDENHEDHENHENHENVFRNDVNHSLSIAERRFISKTSTKKRPRDNTSSNDTCEPDGENHDILCRKDTETVIVARKHHSSNGLARKRQQKDSENPDSEIERHGNVYRRNRVAAKKRIYSRKSTKRSEISSDTVFEDENCKNDSYISITTCRKQQQSLKTVKRRTDGISSEAQQSELEYALSERVSPTIIASSELDERRSSIDYQPVVRMMKIDDQVDVDHSILSVTVASNRRLRSSSSPRSNNQPPKKRLKTSRSQFGRWLKSS